MTADARVPGVYREELFPVPQPVLLTGVPVFLGKAARGPADTPIMLSAWPQFAAQFGGSPTGYLQYAVRAFFENGGRLCYVVRLDTEPSSPEALTLAALRSGLDAAAALDDVDLVCAPDLAQETMTLTGVSTALSTRYMVDTELQRAVLDHCRQCGDRFAILDGSPDDDVEQTLARRSALHSSYGALYVPWVVAAGEDRRLKGVPPCGHIAGIYARGDARVGVHKAPANEVVEGALDVLSVPQWPDQGPLGVGRPLTRNEEAWLFEQGVNYIRPFIGRGIRVWGARTLSDDPGWRYVGVRRLFLTAGRWLRRFMAQLAFEPNTIRLWARIMRELSAYFDTLYRTGALAGAHPQQAYYVKCDRETNPPEVIERGEVVTEIGLAPTTPNEFIVARIVRTSGGASIEIA